MSNERLKMRSGKAILAGVVSITAILLLQITGCKEKQQPKSAEPNNPAQTQKAGEPNRPAASATAKPVSQTVYDSKLTLNEIISRRMGWDPAFMNWYGKPAPDFTVTDINGVKHTLSEYKGKNVMIIFWATWCGPCIKEIPHLIQLRKDIGEDKLAMLAISYVDPRNTPAAVKMFVEKNPVINYTVISVYPDALPGPYNIVDSIPSSFFIDPQGKIKFATEGMISLPQIKAIIEAER